MENGAKGVREPWEEKDEHGSVVMATVQTVSTLHTSSVLLLTVLCPPQYGDTTHTFIERTNYSDQHFLPGYVMGTPPDPVLDSL